jgi:hypothetical protein
MRARKLRPDTLRGAPTLYVDLETTIGGRSVRIRFPDLEHRDLFIHGRATAGGIATAAHNVRRLSRYFARWQKGTVPCRDKCSHAHSTAFEELHQLAQDYVDDIIETSSNPVNVINGPFLAPLFIEPDRVSEWWKNAAEKLNAWVLKHQPSLGQPDARKRRAKPEQPINTRPLRAPEAALRHNVTEQRN